MLGLDECFVTPIQYYYYSQPLLKAKKKKTHCFVMKNDLSLSNTYVTNDDIH